MGQWPVSLIEYPKTLKEQQIRSLEDKKEPNIAGRSWCLQQINNFPWNLKK